MRSLAADEQELWNKVTATIRPLSREPLAESPPPPPPPASEPKRVRGRVPAPRPQPPSPAKRSRPHADATLDASWDKRLRSGSVDPDRWIDLHGMNLDRAWAAIDTGLERAIAAGDRLVLLITGHERPGEPPVKRGKIRAAVHDWLAASRHSGDIAAVRGAHKRHGGGGSLYIILRRRR